MRKFLSMPVRHIRVLFLFMLFLVAGNAFGAHFRYGNVSWTRISETSTHVTIRLNVSLAFQTSPTTVARFNFSGGTTTGFVDVPMTNVYDGVNGWYNGTGSATTTLAKSAGLYRLTYSSSAKIGSLANNANTGWTIFTYVNTSAGGSSPVSTLPAIINMPIGATAATYTIPASDPDPGSTLRYRLAKTGVTPVELAGSQPAGLTIDSITGQLTFNTTNTYTTKTVGQLWNTAVVVTDNNNNAIMLDFIIKITGASTPPAFDYAVTPTNGTVFNVIAGQNVSFGIRATDTDAGSTVNLSASGLPSYITASNFSPAFPAAGNPAQTNFSWTPTASQVGNTVVLSFIATDNVGVQVTTSVTLKVIAQPAPVFIAPSPAAGSTRQIETGMMFSDVISASSSNGSAVSIAYVSGLPSGALLSPSLPTPGSDPGTVTMTWLPTPANFGVHNISFDATITAVPTIFSSLSYQLIVNTIPSFASAAPSNVTLSPGQTFTYNIVANDPDMPFGDILAITTQSLPSWLTLTPTGNGTAVLSGTPSVGDAGNYSIDLHAEDTYHHGYTTHVGQQFSINVVSTPSFTVQPANATCSGVADGSITINATGGNNIYEYSINGSPYAAGNVYSALLPGNYLVNVRSNGFEGVAQNVTVGVNPDVIQPVMTACTNVTIASCETVIPDYTTSAKATDNCTAATNLVYTQSPAAGTAIAAGTTVSVTITAKDAAGNVSLPCAFTVTRPNITPVAVNDAASLCTGSSVNINVLGNDSHPQGSVLTVNDYTNPSVGSLVKNNDNTFSYSAPAGYSGPVTFTYTIKASDATIGFSGNGHYYEWVPAYGISWTDAKAQASTKTYNGLKGYLVTVTSQAEMSFVAAKLQGQGWMGASDLAYEGTWRWVTGPEGLENGGQGRHFSNQYKYAGYNCNAAQAPGVNGYYANWAGGEPNDCGAYPNQWAPNNIYRGGEHYAHFYGGGIWNDYPNSVGGAISGYIVEYGGLEGCIPQLTATATVTINVNANPVVSLTATGGTTACPGSKVALTASSTAGSGSITGYEWLRNGVIINGASAASYDAPSTGSYQLKVTNSNGCATLSNAVQVSIEDVTPPVITCPGSVTVSNDPGKCGAVVNFTTPTATDNCSGSGGSGKSVLIIWDEMNSNTIALKNALTAAGSNVTLSATSETGYNGTNPSLNGFDAVIHLNGTTYYQGMPAGGQSALVDFVLNKGKTYITEEWSAYEVDDNPTMTAMSDIVVLRRTSGTHTVVTYSAVAAQMSHPVLNGIPAVFQLPSAGANVGQARVYASNQPKVLMTSEYGDAVAVREFANGGKAVQFQHAGNYAGSNVLTDPNVQKLYINAVNYSGSGVSVVQTSGLPSGSTFPVGTTTNVFEATDAAGNKSTCSFVVTVNDTEKPALIGVPQDETVQCQSVPAVANVTATDNCTTGMTVNFTETRTDGNCSGNYTLTRTWSVTDASNNTATASQVITVQDNTDPTFTRPADITIYTNANCGYDASVNVTGDVTDENDNCATGIEATYSDVVANGNCEGAKIITRTWHLADNCGNTASQVQVITVSDNTAPTFTRPADITIYTNANCGYDASVTATGDVTDEKDNCSTGIQATYSDVVVNGSCEGTKIITRTWHLADNCGNAAADQVQIITVSDNTAPTFTRPADVTIYTNANCSYDASSTATGDVTNESDNCSTGIQATYTDVVVNGSCAGTKIITRTWHLADNCGNAAADQVQTITVSDNTAPTVTSVTASVFHCYDAHTNGSYTVPVITATDNCTPSVTYSYSVTGANGSTVRSGNTNNASGNFPVGTNTVNWTITDDCGNSSVAQTIVIINPPITGTISNFTVLGQGAQSNTLYLGYTPASSATITVTAAGGTAPYTYSWSTNGSNSSYSVVAGNPAAISITAVAAGTYTYTVTVTDSKGCTATFTKTIMVVDIRCGNNNDKVLVCHIPPGNPGKPQTICIAAQAVPAHLAKGATLGMCNASMMVRSDAPKTPAKQSAASLLAYPNPNRGQFNLKLNDFKAGRLHIEITDGRGKVVLVKETTVSYSIEDIGLDLSKLAAGVYNVKVRGEKELKYTRVIIAR